MAAVSWKILSTFANIPPQAFDAIHPHGPVSARLFSRRGDAVSLNPQPLPPIEAVVGAQLLENVLVSAIIIVSGRDTGEAAGLLRAEIDDWCGTGWPHKWPKPKPPKGWDDSQVFAGAALAAANLAAQYDHSPQLQDALGAAAEQLAEAAAAR
jgi:hypothetical protein